MLPEAVAMEVPAHALAWRPDVLAGAWIEDLDALAGLAPEWDALCDACPWSTPFQRPAWALAALRELEPSAPRVLAIRQSGALVGVLPLATLSGAPRTWVIAGTGPSDLLDLVARASDARDVARAAMRAVAAHPGSSALELHELRERSPLLAAAREGLAGRVVADDPLSVAPLLRWPEGASSLDDVVPAAWSRRVRYERRRAEREGLVHERADRHDDDETVDAAIDAWWRNHEARWGERSANASRERFLRSAVRALVHQGLAEIHSLRLRGERCASYLVLRERSWAGMYAGGFAPTCARSSPLVVVLASAMEQLASEGVRELDFLRGAESYKHQWGAEDRTLRRVRIERAR